MWCREQKASACRGNTALAAATKEPQHEKGKEAEPDADEPGQQASPQESGQIELLRAIFKNLSTVVVIKFFSSS